MRTSIVLPAAFFALLVSLSMPALAAQQFAAASAPASSPGDSSGPSAVASAVSADPQNAGQASEGTAGGVPETPPQRPAEAPSDLTAPSAAPSPAAPPAAPASASVINPDAPQEQPPQEPKRILYVIPNFRAVSAGSHPPPPSPREAFHVATENSFDYSAFIFVGINSGFSEWDNAHPQLGRGMAGFGQYYWRGFLTRTDSSYLVLFVLPTAFHQDERYYEKGKGSFFARLAYAASRVLITPNYEGNNSFNVSQLLGQGIAQSVAMAYYPSMDRTPGKYFERYGLAIGRGALTNILREFWPDISSHVLHHRR
jgi:hypothetical protein